MSKKLPIGKRLTASFLWVSLLVALSGGVGLVVSSRIGHQADIILDEKYPIAREAQTLRSLVDAELIALHSFLLGEADALNLLKKADEDALQQIQVLSNIILTQEKRDVLNKIQVDYEAHEVLENKIVQMAQANVPQNEILTFLKEMEDETDALVQEVLQLVKLSDRDMAQSMAEADRLQKESRITLIVVTLVAFIIAFGLGRWIATGITTPLKTLVEHAKHIAKGNLALEVAGQEDSDEIGELARSFHTMAEGLRQQISEIIDGTSVLSSSVAELSASSTQLAASSAENAASINETSSTLEEIRQTSELASTKAEQMAEDALHICENSQQGRDATEQAVDGMHKIQTQMSTIAETIISLSEQSQAIGQIIATVDSLSEQSNVLAVNASIEAAKAGEQGKGFSVVAQEVKSLAEQSKQATTQVRSILNEIQKATSTAVMATEQGNKVVEKGTLSATQAGQSILALAESLSQSADSATQIAATNQQQRVGLDQIASAVESVNEASQQNATSARQLETAVETLKELGNKLNDIANSYNI